MSLNSFLILVFSNLNMSDQEPSSPGYNSRDIFDQSMGNLNKDSDYTEAYDHLTGTIPQVKQMVGFIPGLDQNKYNNIIDGIVEIINNEPLIFSEQDISKKVQDAIRITKFPTA